MNALTLAKKDFAFPWWWLGVLLLSYLTASLYVSIFYSMHTHICGGWELFAAASYGVVLGAYGLLGAFFALLVCKFLTWIQIPAPINRVVPINASLLSAILARHALEQMCCIGTTYYLFELCIMPTIIGGATALIAMPYSESRPSTDPSSSALAIRKALFTAKLNFDKYFLALLKIVRLPWWMGALILSFAIVGGLAISLGFALGFILGAGLIGFCGGLSVVIVFSKDAKFHNDFVLALAATLMTGAILHFLQRLVTVTSPLALATDFPLWLYMLMAHYGGITTLICMPCERLTVAKC
jgi:hypothetical protein